METLIELLIGKLLVVGIVILLAISLVIFLCKKFKASKKTITIIIICISLIVLGIILINTFKILNPRTITQEEREKAIATIEYANIIGFDAANYNTYYIYTDKNNKYWYFETYGNITIRGALKENIIKKGKITNRNKLEKIINELENKVTSDFSFMTIDNGKIGSKKAESVTIFYNGNKIEKQELLDKLFN